METIELKSWEKFEEAVSLFMLQIEGLRRSTILPVSVPLFRGHACASWRLETTLDRLTASENDKDDYHRVIQGVRPAIVTITGKSWDIPDDSSTEGIGPVPAGYDFMIYLRHHGFPSPLLDWSRSPYVAAFFAFRTMHRCDEPNVAINVFVESMGEMESYNPAEPRIFGLGPYVVSHKRHYAQQCEYTICKKQKGDKYLYCNHEYVAAKREEGQDHLRRYLLPKSERAKALKKLELLNVTAFSLFGNEESLMETLAYQELEKRLLSKVYDKPEV